MLFDPEPLSPEGRLVEPCDGPEDDRFSLELELELLRSGDPRGFPAKLLNKDWKKPLSGCPVFEENGRPVEDDRGGEDPVPVLAVLGPAGAEPGLPWFSG